MSFLVGLPLMILAQSFEDLSFGTDNTLDVITWNIEHFPKDDQTTMDNVAEIMQAMQAEVYAFQEIDDTADFREMVDEIPGYEWFIHDGYYAGLAYAYKSTLEVVDIYKIYTQETYWRPFPRAPQIMHLRVDDEDFYVINNHYKCCGDGYMDLDDEWDEETRRFDASSLIKEYIDEELPNANVIITGDLNDILTDNSSNNVFQMFIDDENNYLCADMDIAEGNDDYWSYPSWPSHLDHIIITNELVDELNDEAGAIETILVDDYFSGWWQYDDDVSDHRPVGIKLQVDFNTAIEQLNPDIALSLFPNPANVLVNITLGSDAKEGELLLISPQGEVVKQMQIRSSVQMNVDDLMSGMYFLQFTSDDGNRFVKKLMIE